MTVEDWFKLAQQIVSLLTPFFLAWLALQYAKLNKSVDKQGLQQSTKMDDISKTINGHMTALGEAKIAVGRLAGIAEEQARALRATNLALTNQADAARTLVTNARTLQEQVVTAAEVLAERKRALAQGVDRDPVSAEKLEPEK